MSSWQPIETAPKDGTHVIISVLSPYTTEDGGTDFDREYRVSQWWCERWTNCNYAEGLHNREYATHWLLLPEHPKS